jgi:hypothetical protein
MRGSNDPTEVLDTVKYLLLICGTESRLNDDQRMAAWGEYTNNLATAGKMRGGERLRPAASATTLRLTGGDRLLSDGPYAETKEQLGGFFVIEASNLDEAVELASAMPHLQDGGSVEIRPVWDMD